MPNSSLRERVIATEAAMAVMNALPLPSLSLDTVFELATMLASEANEERPVITLSTLFAAYDLYMRYFCAPQYQKVRDAIQFYTSEPFDSVFPLTTIGGLLDGIDEDLAEYTDRDDIDLPTQIFDYVQQIRDLLGIKGGSDGSASTG